jgi:hypothetical protein
MADLGGWNLRNERRVWCLLAGLSLCSTMACSDGTDITGQVNGNAAGPAAPGDGVLTGSPVPPADVLGGPTLPEPQASSAGSPPAPQANPPPVQAPAAEEPSSPGGEPQPSATETNFFGAGCRSDADCGENRRCEFPLEADAGASLAPEDAATPDAGADAAAPESLVPRGHCVAL